LTLNRLLGAYICMSLCPCIYLFLSTLCLSVYSVVFYVSAILSSPLYLRLWHFVPISISAYDTLYPSLSPPIALSLPLYPRLWHFLHLYISDYGTMSLSLSPYMALPPSLSPLMTLCPPIYLRL